MLLAKTYFTFWEERTDIPRINKNPTLFLNTETQKTDPYYIAYDI